MRRVVFKHAIRFWKEHVCSETDLEGPRTTIAAEVVALRELLTDYCIDHQWTFFRKAA